LNQKALGIEKNAEIKINKEGKKIIFIF